MSSMSLKQPMLPLGIVVKQNNPRQMNLQKTPSQTKGLRNENDDNNVIQIHNMGVCDWCGTMGVKHAFYTKERNFCTQACVVAYQFAGPPKIPPLPTIFYGKPQDKKAKSTSEKEKLGRLLNPMKKIRPRRNDKDSIANTFLWEASISDPSFYAAPVSIFYHTPAAQIWKHIEIGMKAEIYSTASSACHLHLECGTAWLGTLVRICGYFGLFQYAFCEDRNSDENSMVWVNLCSEQVRTVGWSAANGKPLLPPKSIAGKHCVEDWRLKVANWLTGAITIPWMFAEKSAESQVSRFKQGMMVEAVDKNRIAQVKLASIVDISRKRLVIKYFDSDAEDVGFVCHEDSPLLHPCGWAAAVDAEIDAPLAYLVSTETDRLSGSHKAMDKYFKLPPTSNSEDKVLIKTGMKLEAIDPLNLSAICVATVKKVLLSGYMMIRIDSYAEDESYSDWFCYHVSSPYIFPAGFCDQHKIKLVPPKDYRRKFVWSEYLEETGYKAAPFSNRSVPNHGFEVGMRLEAADLMDPRLICVAKISRVCGRLLRVHFDGWGEEYDQWLDCECPDIYPVGWCELHGHRLEGPRDVPSKSVSGGGKSHKPDKKRRGNFGERSGSEKRSRGSPKCSPENKKKCVSSVLSLSSSITQKPDAAVIKADSARLFTANKMDTSKQNTRDEEGLSDIKHNDSMMKTSETELPITSSRIEANTTILDSFNQWANSKKFDQFMLDKVEPNTSIPGLKLDESFTSSNVELIAPNLSACYKESMLKPKLSSFKNKVYTTKDLSRTAGTNSSLMRNTKSPMFGVGTNSYLKGSQFLNKKEKEELISTMAKRLNQSSSPLLPCSIFDSSVEQPSLGLLEIDEDDDLLPPKLSPNLCGNREIMLRRNSKGQFEFKAPPTLTPSASPNASPNPRTIPPDISILNSKIDSCLALKTVPKETVILPPLKTRSLSSGTTTTHTSTLTLRGSSRAVTSVKPKVSLSGTAVQKRAPNGTESESDRSSSKVVRKRVPNDTETDSDRSVSVENVRVKSLRKRASKQYETDSDQSPSTINTRMKSLRKKTSNDKETDSDRSSSTISTVTKTTRKWTPNKHKNTKSLKALQKSVTDEDDTDSDTSLNVTTNVNTECKRTSDMDKSESDLSISSTQLKEHHTAGPRKSLNRAVRTCRLSWQTKRRVSQNLINENVSIHSINKRPNIKSMSAKSSRKPANKQSPRKPKSLASLPLPVLADPKDVPWILRPTPSKSYTTIHSASARVIPCLLGTNSTSYSAENIVPSEWSVKDVAHFLQINNCGQYSESFSQRKIGGVTLLNLTYNTIIFLTSQKAGPALLINELIQKLKAKISKPETNEQLEFPTDAEQVNGRYERNSTKWMPVFGDLTFKVF